MKTIEQTKLLKKFVQECGLGKIIAESKMQTMIQFGDSLVA